MTGIERFNSYLNEWEVLADKANASGNIAEYCLNNNARTIFFMLEALCKVYKSLHNEKMFSKQGDRFKEIEDLLGDMDHYRECIDDYKKRENAAGEVLKFYETKYEEARNKLNTLLIEKDWLNGKRIRKLRKKFDEADWLSKKEEVYAFRKYYLDEIDEFKDLYAATGNFTLIEDHLHEFRRRLRWFSIYPHALQGAVQFTEDTAIPDELVKYQTEVVISSPFNKFPAHGDQTYVLTLEKSRFLALSWIIDALGKLKDKALLEENLTKAVEATNSTQSLLNSTQFEKEILRDTNNIMHTFMADRVLENMVREVKKL